MYISPTAYPERHCSLVNSTNCLSSNSAMVISLAVTFIISSLFIYSVLLSAISRRRREVSKPENPLPSGSFLTSGSQRSILSLIQLHCEQTASLPATSHNARIPILTPLYNFVERQTSQQGYTPPLAVWPLPSSLAEPCRRSASTDRQLRSKPIAPSV